MANEKEKHSKEDLKKSTEGTTWIGKATERISKSLIENIDDTENAKSLLDLITNWKIAAEDIDRDTVIDLAKAGVLHKAKDLLIDDLMEYFWEVVSREELIKLCDYSREIERAKENHKGVWEIEDEIDEDFWITE